jgi:ATP-binding cassette, subfamily C (CFTR/MRP), member 1
MTEPLSKAEEQSIRDEYKEKYTKGPGPFAEANLFSKLMFSWLSPIIDISQKVEFTQDLHFKLRESDKSNQMTEILENNWKKYHPEGQVKPGTKTPVLSFYLAIWDSTKAQLFLGIFLQALQVVFEFFGAYLVYNAIERVQLIDYSMGLAANSDKLLSVTYIMGLFVFLRILGSAMGLWLTFYLSIEGMKIRNSLMNVIFKKLLRKGTERDNTFDLADITNLTQVDAATFSDLGSRFGEAVSIPLRIVGGVIALGVLMGKAIFPSLLVLAAVSLGNIVIMNFYKRFKDGYMQASDLKGKLVNEIFRNIKFIKMQGLENYYLLKLRELREKELFWVSRQFMRNVAANFNTIFGPELFMLVLYVTKLLMTGDLR